MGFPPIEVEHSIPVVVIVDAEDPKISDLNLQIDDIDAVYELECTVKLKSVIAFLENGKKAGHQYILELQSVEKLKLEE